MSLLCPTINERNCLLTTPTSPDPKLTPPTGGRKPHTERVEIFLPSTLGYEKVARSAAEAVAQEMGFSDDRIEDLKTAVAEACMNAIEHGNQGSQTAAVTVLLTAANEQLEVR